MGKYQVATIIRTRLRSWWDDRPSEVAFLVLGLVFGVLFTFGMPPTQAADETTHFYRAYQLTEGHVLSRQFEHGVGDYLPRDTMTITKQLYGDIPSHYDRTFNYRQLPHLLKQKLNEGDRVLVHFEGATVYSPVGYLPQMFAIMFARIAWPSVTLMYYLGRLANLAIWLALMLLALRWWPLNKWALFALALTPMSLTQATSLSPDALANALAFLMIAAALRLAHSRHKITTKRLGWATLLVVLISLIKPVFFIFAGLGLLWSIRQCGGKKRQLIVLGALIGVGLFVTIAWNLQVKGYTPGIRYYVLPKLDIDEKRQLMLALGNPIGTLIMLGRTYLSSVGNVVTTTFIGRLGWWDIDLPLWLVFTNYAMIIVGTITREAQAIRLKFRQRLIAGLIWLAGFLATSAVLYLTITVVGADHINGLQGRYFIAFSPLLAASFGGVIEITNWERISRWLYPLCYTLVLGVSLFVAINRFV